jgi:hypothetical protein
VCQLARDQSKDVLPEQDGSSSQCGNQPERPCAPQPPGAKDQRLECLELLTSIEILVLIRTAIPSRRYPLG